jgi:hypothetical protein
VLSGDAPGPVLVAASSCPQVTESPKTNAVSERRRPSRLSPWRRLLVFHSFGVIMVV